MKEEEKAKELIEKFTEIAWWKGAFPKIASNLQGEVKEQAILCCDEIISNIRTTIPIIRSSNEIVGDSDYWEAVKEAIKKY